MSVLQVEALFMLAGTPAFGQEGLPPPKPQRTEIGPVGHVGSVEPQEHEHAFAALGPE